jgi:hypothetical protein
MSILEDCHYKILSQKDLSKTGQCDWSTYFGLICIFLFCFYLFYKFRIKQHDRNSQRGVVYNDDVFIRKVFKN